MAAFMDFLDKERRDRQRNARPRPANPWGHVLYRAALVCMESRGARVPCCENCAACAHYRKAHED